MTNVGCTKDKCCDNKNCMATHHHGDNDCRNYVPKMKFAGFGRAYVPKQRLCELFSGKEGFVAGTIFPELHIPYEGNILRSQNMESEEVDKFA